MRREDLPGQGHLKNQRNPKPPKQITTQHFHMSFYQKLLRIFPPIFLKNSFLFCIIIFFLISRQKHLLPINFFPILFINFSSDSQEIQFLLHQEHTFRLKFTKLIFYFVRFVVVDVYSDFRVTSFFK